MRRQFLNHAIQVGIATVLFSATTAVHAQAPTKINFRLDWTVYGTHAPFYLALDKGLYAKEGLQVKIEEGQGSGTVAKLVAQGNDHMGFVDFTSMIRAVEQGMPLVAVMRVVSNNMAIVSHADAPINHPKELEGKVIAYAPSESTAQMFPALALLQKAEMGKINVINPAFGAKNALFLQKRADAFTASTNVQIAQVEAQGAKTAYFRYSDFGVSLMNNGIVANKDFIAKNPEALRKFLRVTREAFEMATANPAEAVEAMVRQRPQDARHRSVLLRQLQLSPELYTTERTKGQPFGYMDSADWADNQALLVKYGGLPKAVPVDTLYTNDFLPK